MSVSATTGSVPGGNGFGGLGGGGGFIPPGEGGGHEHAAGGGCCGAPDVPVYSTKVGETTRGDYVGDSCITIDLCRNQFITARWNEKKEEEME